ncbi:organic hydroperoxide resistance protein [Nocardia sp. NEAU-G5]|uniref:Organic hydroperoxide resistance protein n=1 Tax=Nocardia albiluteola TaxID=2842303 RepID=A0ABS6ASM6_9NOCA|nr:organic hydroperoxide resistance protein [Nocardia albiluteola]MBU3061040.1 organic hydroperoxide resistance protein [Nocardia albiluteola]
MPDKILYTAVADATGDGRNGHVTTDDGLLDLDLAIQRELGGTGGRTNPEQLFAAGYAACFHNSLRVVARRAKADVSGSAVTARVGIGPEDTGYGLAVTLRIHLPGVEPSQATELVEAAHQVCPYSRATRGNLDVELQLAPAGVDA